jgi:hypothetical protein
MYSPIASVSPCFCTPEGCQISALSIVDSSGVMAFTNIVVDSVTSTDLLVLFCEGWVQGKERTPSWNKRAE